MAIYMVDPQTGQSKRVENPTMQLAVAVDERFKIKPSENIDALAPQEPQRASLGEPIARPGSAGQIGSDQVGIQVVQAGDRSTRKVTATYEGVQVSLKPAEIRREFDLKGVLPILRREGVIDGRIDVDGDGKFDGKTDIAFHIDTKGIDTVTVGGKTFVCNLPSPLENKLVHFATEGAEGHGKAAPMEKLGDLARYTTSGVTNAKGDGGRGPK